MKDQKRPKRAVWLYVLVAAALLAAIVLAISLQQKERVQPEPSPAPTPNLAVAAPTANPKTTPLPSATPAPTADSEPSATPVPTDAPHVHDWQPVYMTVHHEEKTHIETVTVQPAWDEPETERTFQCSVCGKTGDDVPGHIMRDHNGEGSYATVELPTGTYIHHEAVTETRVIVDSPEWDEYVLNYYTCTCGDMKKP